MKFYADFYVIYWKFLLLFLLYFLNFCTIVTLEMSKTRNATEMAKLEEVMDKKLEQFGQNFNLNTLEELKNLVKEIKTTLKDQKDKIVELELKSVRQDVRISQLEDKVGVLQASVSALLKQTDNNEQYSRRACLRINGIPKSQNETAENCVEKVINVCKNSLGIDLENKDIDRAHRVGKERKTMIVKFYSFKKRSSIYKNRKNVDAGDDLKVYLDLTRPRLNLLDRSRDKIARNSNVSYVFADINCNTVAKLKDGSFKFFDTDEKFDDLLGNQVAEDVLVDE